jgi:glycosyltransferase involved in cell wall biosynthesis
MRVLMLGWEYPPFISGGLGTACYGLTRAMEHLDLDIVMLLPTSTQNVDGSGTGFSEATSDNPDSPGHVVLKVVPFKLPNPYARARSVRVVGTGQAGGYDGNLIDRVYEYAKRCIGMVKDKTFDVIHAHDWVTFPAAVALSEALKKPLVVHVHATEFDRSGDCVNQAVFDIEREGMERAEAIIAVSKYTAGVIMSHYGIPADKIHVVHNGINPKPTAQKSNGNHNGAKVLFLGRITSQKGPEFFVKAAEQVLRKYENIKFIMAGWGDLAPDIVESVAARRLGSKILFTGFLRGSQVDNAYRMSDLYVMPSVSEPFGLTALEAVQHGLPVILSKTTGVGEILNRGALKVDFWDANKLAQQIIDILDNPSLAGQLRSDATNEIRDLTWDAAARKCLSIYNFVSNKNELVGQNN